MKTNTAIEPVPGGTLPLPADLHAALERDRHALERTLGGLFDSRETKIDEAARRELLGGGKRLRPLLTCAVLRALGQDPSTRVHHIVAVELAHTGSLLHDDIIDDATTRHGMQAAHLAFDVPTAVLAGDSLVVLALESLARGAPPELLIALCQAIRELCAGVSLERERRFDHSVDLDHCRRVNRLKTASLFGYAAEAGAILAGAGQPTRRAARSFGIAIGEAFQTDDDLLDFSGDPARLGKPIGRDLELGMVTVPLAIALERDRSLRLKLRAFWSDLRGGTEAGPRLDAIRERMERVGAFVASRQLASEDTARALTALDVLPRNRWRDLIRDLVLEMLGRSM